MFLWENITVFLGYGFVNWGKVSKYINIIGNFSSFVYIKISFMFIEYY